jgi:hypothetical protein
MTLSFPARRLAAASIFFVACGGAAHAAIITFAYTGSLQTYLIPTTGLYLLSASGAQGGDQEGNFFHRGGLGGVISGDVQLTAGQTLDIVVGGQGQGRGAIYAGGGGGGTFIWIDGQTTPLLVAGGGSGASIPKPGNPGGGAPGNGQPTSFGGAGWSGSSSSSFGGPDGFPDFQGGPGWVLGGRAGNGGYGGGAGGNYIGSGMPVGGGGGGYTGGDMSLATGFSFGGTSYAAPGFTNLVQTEGANAGDGAASIAPAGLLLGGSRPTASAVPEPSTWLMMLAGLAGLGFLGYRRTKAASSA